MLHPQPSSCAQRALRIHLRLRLRALNFAPSGPDSDSGPSDPCHLGSTLDYYLSHLAPLGLVSDFVPPLVSHSYQSLVRPTCNRQEVNLPAGLDTSFLPSQHFRTPVGVPFMTLSPGGTRAEDRMKSKQNTQGRRRGREGMSNINSKA